MYILSLEIVKCCNLNCSYCYLGAKQNVFMKIETAQKAIDLAVHEAEKQYDKKIIVYFIGGEPLLAFDMIKESVSYAEKKCEALNLTLEFSITTNGILLDHKISDYLIEKSFDIKISLDGPEEVHDKNRRYLNGSGSYRDVIEHLRFLRDYQKQTGKKLTAAQVICRNTCNDFFDAIHYLHNIGFKTIESCINSYEEWKEEELQILFGQIRRGFLTYKDLKENGSDVYWNFYESRLENFCMERCFYACGAGFCSIYVTVKGDIYPCTEVDETIAVGHVDTGLNAAKIRKLGEIQKTKNPECLVCRDYRYCQAARCIMINYDLHRNYFIPSSAECRITRYINEMFQNILGEKRLEHIRAYYHK